MADIQDLVIRTDASPVELVGRIVDPTTGTSSIVPLSIRDNGDGTWSLDIDAVITGDVVIGGAMAIRNVAGVTVNPAIYEAQVTTNANLVSILAAVTSTLNASIINSSVTLNTAVVSMPAVTVNISTAVTTLNVQTITGSKVQLTDGTDNNLITASGQVLTSPGRLSGEDIADDSIAVNMNKITPNIYNVACTATATIYSQALPSFCKGFDIKLRETSGILKMSFNSGLATYYTIPSNSAFSVESCSLVSATLYFQSDTATVNAEIIAWS